jgi:hypothetical protein
VTVHNNKRQKRKIKQKDQKKKKKNKVKGIIAELILDNITSKTRSQVLR